VQLSRLSSARLLLLVVALPGRSVTLSLVVVAALNGEQLQLLALLARFFFFVRISFSLFDTLPLSPPNSRRRFFLLVLLPSNETVLCFRACECLFEDRAGLWLPEKLFLLPVV
jgi:hypothetical protein